MKPTTQSDNIILQLYGFIEKNKEWEPFRDVFRAIKNEEIVYVLYSCGIGMCYDHELRLKRNNKLVLQADIGDMVISEDIEQELEKGVRELRNKGFRIDYRYEREVKYELNKNSTVH